MAVAKVTYKGISDIRILPASDLAEHGVSVPRDLVFYRRPHEGSDSIQIDLSPSLEKILRADGGFKISAVKDSGAEGETIVSTDAEQPGKIVIEDETGKTKG